MSHYILLHGAWEESRMWDDVSPILQQNGHTVTAIDLPGHGGNKYPNSLVTTSGYIQAVVDVIKQLDHQVILVGHSMNGALISHVAEQIPEKIERLIYVTAFLLKDGGSVLEAMQSDADRWRGPSGNRIFGRSSLRHASRGGFAENRFSRYRRIGN